MTTEDNQRPARRALGRPVDAAGFRAFVQSGWDEPVREPRLAGGAAQAAAEHRRRLGEQFPGRRVVVAAGRAPVRSNDTDYAFRPDSDFSWLTGCDAEGAVLVMHPVAGGHEAVLYLRAPAGPKEVDFFANPRDGQLWIGAVPGLDEWSRALGIPCRDLDGLPAALRGRHPVTVAVTGVDPLVDALVEGGSSGALRTTLAELRTIKDNWEIDQLRAAVDATVLGFAEVAAELPAAVAGGGERWLQGTFDRRARTSGNGPGYATIVAAGEHAPILHWVRCDGPVPEDGLVLLDAGVELATLYTADVTRTFPASGRFSPAQRQVHDLVERAHRAAVAEVRPGQDYSAFQHTAMAVLAQGLHDWGLLPVSVDEALESDNQHHRRYIVCGISHYLGLDVHDCASARAAAYHEATLRPGMALTVEPGLYFHPTDQTVPPELRGIGVRIEDDLVVTDSGAEVLSGALPVDADGLERWVASQW